MKWPADLDAAITECGITRTLFLAYLARALAFVVLIFAALFGGLGDAAVIGLFLLVTAASLAAPLPEAEA